MADVLMKAVKAWGGGVGPHLYVSICATCWLPWMLSLNASITIFWAPSAVKGSMAAPDSRTRMPA